MWKEEDKNCRKIYTNKSYNIISLQWHLSIPAIRMGKVRVGRRHPWTLISYIALQQALILAQRHKYLLTRHEDGATQSTPPHLTIVKEWSPSSQKQQPNWRPTYNLSRPNMKVHLSGTDHLGSILVLGGKIYYVIYIYSIISLFQQTHLGSDPQYFWA